MDRLTNRDKHGIAMMRLDLPWGSSLVARLADYEDTDMTPEEIVTIKKERDASVRDLELLMMRGTPGDDACSMCKRWNTCKEEVSDEGSCNCRPEWRGPKEGDKK